MEPSVETNELLSSLQSFCGSGENWKNTSIPPKRIVIPAILSEIQRGE